MRILPRAYNTYATYLQPTMLGNERPASLYGTLAKRYASGDTDVEGIRITLITMGAFGFVFVSAIAWAICYFAVGAFALWFLFPSVIVVSFIIATIHLSCTGKVWLARNLLCYVVPMASLGVHWSFGRNGASYGAYNWAFLGPQLALITRYVTIASAQKLPGNPLGLHR